MIHKVKITNLYVPVFLMAFLLTSLFIFFNSESAYAMLIKKDLGTLAADAQIIMTGEVADLQSVWEDKKIYTYVTVSTQNLFKGVGDKEVIIKVPGGTAGGITCRVSDTPAFKKGEEIFAFLRPMGTYYEVVGAKQGKYTVQKDKIMGLNVPVNEISALISEKTGEIQKVEKGGTEPGLGQTTRKAFPLLQNGESSLLGSDQSGKQNFTLPGSSSAGQSSWTTILDEGFESNWPSTDPKWYLQGESPCEYTWGRESNKPHTGNYSAWCAGASMDSCSDLNPAADNYQDDMDAWMVYGPFDLSDATSARMTFYIWNQSESDFDEFYCGCSTDGINFIGYTLSGDWTPWSQYTLSLNEVCGQSEVWVGLEFSSDLSISYKGTFIDDLVIEKYDGPIPQITNISPDFGPAAAKYLNTYEAAEDSTQVTISGGNFGSAQGIVEFWQGDLEYFPASIISWSEDRIDCLVPGGASSYYHGKAGNVYVITDEGIESEPALFRVTYSYGGGRAPENTLVYKVNANTADCAGEGNAVQEAANAWNSAGADFQFEYGGATDTTSVGFDSENSVIWANEGETDWRALTSTWWGWDLNIMLENDVEFNDYYSWSTAAGCPAGRYDVQGIATHELGHALGLLDLYGTADSEKTMYGISSTGETKKRTLEPDDIDGIKYIYGLARSIEGFAKLEKLYPGSDEPDHSGTQVKATQGGSVVGTFVTASDGSYTVTGVAAGSCDLEFSHAGGSWRTTIKTVTVGTGVPTDAGTVTLNMGDMNGDDTIDISDLLWMVYYIGPVTEESQKADVNGDGEIDISDLLRVVADLDK